MKFPFKPMEGMVIVEVVPEKPTGAIQSPDYTPTADENQRSARDPQMPQAIKGRVRAIGSWPKNKQGLAILPEFGIGALVVIPPRSGLELHRNIGERFRMVRQDKVLAVINPAER